MDREIMYLEAQRDAGIAFLRTSKVKPFCSLVHKSIHIASLHSIAEKYD